MNLGIAGEVRAVVIRADGSTKSDTGFQKNLILNQGLDFFGGAHNTSFFQSCGVGAGNSAPSITQNQLDAVIKIVSGSESGNKNSYEDDGSNLHKTSKTYSYSFTDLDDVNISEVGLYSSSASAAINERYLLTRALIKDSNDTPTSISVKLGEVLKIFYKVWQVITTADILHTINLVDGTGNSTPFNTVSRLSHIAQGYSNRAYLPDEALKGVDGGGNLRQYELFSGDLGDINNFPTGSSLGNGQLRFDDYIEGSFKRIAYYDASINFGNGSIRSLHTNTTLGIWQVRFGSVADDSPILKTNQDTLTIPIEFSWGRYQGAL